MPLQDTHGLPEGELCRPSKEEKKLLNVPARRLVFPLSARTVVVASAPAEY
jgi:hypothetical protein